MTAGYKLIAIIGATASGKSSLAMGMARATGAEILSLDSMQVYRGMNIGTAKPSPTEQAEVRHHLIDVADASDGFSVAEFQQRADAVIVDAKRRGVPLIAVGGTPLYYKALFEGLFEGPSADASIRKRLSAESNETLHARLKQVDPAAAERIHQNDQRRIVRALEVYEITGRPISSLQSEWSSGAMRHEAIWFGLSWDRDALNRRINARVKQMISDGWVDETRRLLDRPSTLSMTAAEATGYAELIAHLRGKMSLDDAVEQIKIATRQLARRQMKWFKRFTNVNWLPGDAPIESTVERALSLLC